jgi:hypothetical protein
LGGSVRCGLVSVAQNVIALGAKGAVANQGERKSAGGRVLTIAGRPVELTITFVNPQTLRLSLLSVHDTGTAASADDDVAKYWATRLEVFCDDVDGWWPHLKSGHFMC